MTLERCYDAVKPILGVGAEPFSVVQCVDQHREYWRPERVHTILLAESHVRTDVVHCIPMNPRNPIALSDGMAGSTSKFARFVYCLGYGENEYAGFNPGKNDDGTWQYWKIFSSCVAQPSKESFARILKGGNPKYESRLNSKIALLHQLKAMGVWLVDASVVALYRPGGGKPSQKNQEKIIQYCWDNYVGNLVKSAKPHSIIVIGNGVKKALCSRLETLSGVERRDVAQPQKRMSTTEIAKTHQIYFEVCQQAMKSRTAG